MANAASTVRGDHPLPDRKPQPLRGRAAKPGPGRPDLTHSVPSIAALARTWSRAAIYTLADCMHESMEPAIRVRAAEALLNRGWGAPVQYTEVNATVVQKVISGEPISTAEWEARYTAGEVIDVTPAEDAAHE